MGQSGLFLIAAIKCVQIPEGNWFGGIPEDPFVWGRIARQTVQLDFQISEAVLKIGLGGGCHWCTEAVFQALDGVNKVEQGFIRSDPPEDSWSEAVIVTFDPAVMPLEVLIEVHLRTHSSTSHHKMRGKYRSAVYVYDAGTGVEVGRILRAVQKKFAEKLVTKVLSLAGFKPSDERFWNYYMTDPGRPFCKTYIDPKLGLLRDEYSDSFREAGAAE